MASRDRTHICREGIAAGAPQATQIADRWHLLYNLALSLEDFLLQKRSTLKEAAVPEAEAATQGRKVSSANTLSGCILTLGPTPSPPRPRTREKPGHVRAPRRGDQCPQFLPHRI